MFRPTKFTATLMLATMLTVAALIIPAFASSPAPAPQSGRQPTVKVDLDGSVQRDGKDVSTDGLQVRPGEVITWNMRVSNKGNEGASNIRAAGLIPKGTHFVPGSAAGAGVTVEYSIDGGRSFSPRPMVVVDGKERPASTDSYTNIRFAWAGEIRPGEVKTAHYGTRLR